MAVGLLLAAGVLTYFWWTSDSRRIGRLLDRCEDLVDKRPGEHDLSGLNKARRVGDLFASHFEVRAPQYKVMTTDRGELVRAVVRFRTRSESIHTRFSDRQLWVDAQLHRATLQTVVSFVTDIGGLAGSEAYRLQVNLAEEDGRWRIDFVELLEVLERPGVEW